MYKNIAIINTKGGVGKSTLSFHILPFILRDREFQIIEIDNNNDTVSSFTNSSIKDKIQSLNIDIGTQKLEELVIENMLDDKKINVIDAGGGDDSIKIIESLKSQNLVSDTLFIIPFMPDFTQLKNLQNTYELVQDYQVVVVCNNINLNDTHEMMFLDGNEDYEISSLKKLFDNFFIIPKTHLFSFSTARKKETITDLSQLAFDYNQDEVLDFAKNETGGDKEKMLKIYRDWKISKSSKEYLESENIQKLKSFINE